MRIVYRARVDLHNKISVGQAEVEKITTTGLWLKDAGLEFQCRRRVEPSFVFDTKAEALRDLERRIEREIENARDGLEASEADLRNVQAVLRQVEAGEIA